MKSDVKQSAARWIARRDAGWTDAERAEFERWRGADPRHAEALAQYEHAWNLLNRPRETGEGEVFWNVLGDRFRRRQRRFRTMAASLAIMIAAIVLVQTRTPRPDVATTRAVVVVPEKRTLPDGSIVELKPGAAIEIDFRSSWRRVMLQHGAAHFQVASDPSRPFLVTAGRVEFRATGTAFLLEVGNRGVALLVTEGRVSVEKPALVPAIAESPTTPLALIPAGNRVHVNLTVDGEPSLMPVTTVSDSELQELLAWRAPRLEFSGTPLAEAITLMNRHSRVHIALGDRSLSAVELSGYFRADNTEAFLRVLEATFGIKAEPSGDKVVLRSSR